MTLGILARSFTPENSESAIPGGEKKISNFPFQKNKQTKHGPLVKAQVCKAKKLLGSDPGLCFPPPPPPSPFFFSSLPPFFFPSIPHHSPPLMHTQLDPGSKLGYVRIPWGNSADHQDPKDCVFTCLLAYSLQNERAMLIACLCMSCCYLNETTRSRNSILSVFYYCHGPEQCQVYLLVCIYMCVYIYPALPGQCQHERWYKPLSNFGLVGLLISFWLPEQLSVGLAATKPHTLPHPHEINIAHPVTWKLHSKFWSGGWFFD